jgi:hypothetical protein
MNKELEKLKYFETINEDKMTEISGGYSLIDYYNYLYKMVMIRRG